MAEHRIPHEGTEMSGEKHTPTAGVNVGDNVQLSERTIPLSPVTDSLTTPISEPSRVNVHFSGSRGAPRPRQVHDIDRRAAQAIASALAQQTLGDPEANPAEIHQTFRVLTNPLYGKPPEYMPEAPDEPPASEVLFQPQVEGPELDLGRAGRVQAREEQFRETFGTAPVPLVPTDDTLSEPPARVRPYIPQSLPGVHENHEVEVDPEKRVARFREAVDRVYDRHENIFDADTVRFPRTIIGRMEESLQDSRVRGDYFNYFNDPDVAFQVGDPYEIARALEGVQDYSENLADRLDESVKAGEITPVLAGEYAKRWIVDEPLAQELDDLATMARALAPMVRGEGHGLTRAQIVAYLGDELTEAEHAALTTGEIPQTHDAELALDFAQQVDRWETGNVTVADVQVLFDGLNARAREITLNSPRAYVSLEHEAEGSDVMYLEEPVRDLLNEQFLLRDYQDRFPDYERRIAILDAEEPDSITLEQRLQEIAKAGMYSEFIDEELPELLDGQIPDDVFDRQADILALDVRLAREMDDAMEAILRLNDALAAEQPVSPIHVVNALRTHREVMRRAFPAPLEQPEELDN